MEVSLFTDDGGILDLVDQSAMEILAEVRPRVSASFGSSPEARNTHQDVNFGQLRKGLKREVDFSVSANTGYEISMSSLNDSALLHEKSDNRIRYDVLLDGQQVALDETASSSHALSGNAVSHHDLVFLISDDATNAAAGRYTDEVTIVITAE